MPYISAKDDRREKLRNGEPALTAGELNYQIFYYVKHFGCEIFVMKGFVDQFLGDHPNYQKYNDMTGALIRCYIEIKRRLNKEIDYLLELDAYYDKEIADYEDIKCKENGDVE